MTLKGNSFRGISGRGPKVGGSTVMHAVNNVWSDVVGKAFETESAVSILMEGNVFDGVKTPIKTGGGGKILAVNSASAGTACKSALGRDCVANSLSGAGALSGSDGSVPKLIKNPAKAVSASQAKSNVAASAGFGKL